MVRVKRQAKPWRPEPVKIENFSDELWVGVKG